jgi:hypothetical protein
MADSDPIAAYLDELRKRLRGSLVRHSPERTAQILAEAEDHLRSATTARGVDGVPEEDAQQAAIAAFGQVRTVARSHRPRLPEVLTTLGVAAVPLVSAYLLIASVLGDVYLQRVMRVQVATPTGSLWAPMTFSTAVIQNPASTAALLVALLLLVGYIISRRRLKGKRVPLPSFFPPAAAVVAAAFGWAEYQFLLRPSTLMTRIGDLVGIHSYHLSLAALAIGSLAAAALITLACALWTAALTTRWSYRHACTLATR